MENFIFWAVLVAISLVWFAYDEDKKRKHNPWDDVDKNELR